MLKPQLFRCGTFYPTDTDYGSFGYISQLENTVIHIFFVKFINNAFDNWILKLERQKNFTIEQGNNLL